MRFAFYKSLALPILILVFLGMGLTNGQNKVKRSSNRGAKQRQQVLATDWQIFRSPDEDFTIEFPNEPKRDEDAPGEVAVRHRYSYFGNSLWLSISFEDLGFPLESRQANDLGPNFARAMAKRTKERGGKTIRTQRLAKNIWEEERLVPSKQSNNYRHVISRIVQRNSRMYTLGCVPLVDGQKIDKTMCRRFFNSFRIIGIPQ